MWRIIGGAVLLLGWIALRIGFATAIAPEHDPRVAACYSEGPAETRIAACSELAADPEQIAPNRALALATIGDQLLTDDPQAAIEKYNHAIQIDPETLSHRTALTYALLRTGDIEAAGAAIEQAAAINADDYNVLWLRSELAFQRGAYAAAARQYGDLIDGLPAYDEQMQRQRTIDRRAHRIYVAYGESLLGDESTLRLWRSISFFNAGDRFGADRERNAATELEPQALAQLSVLCDQHARQSQNAVAARALCDAAAAYSPGHVSPLINRAIISLRSRNWRQALIDSNAVISVTHAPRSMRGLDITTQAGQDEATRQAQNNAHRAQGLYARGIARQHLGEESAGARDIADALEANSSVGAFFGPLAQDLAAADDAPALDLRPRTADL